MPALFRRTRFRVTLADLHFRMTLWRRAERAEQCFVAAARDFFVAAGVGVVAFISFRIAHKREDSMAKGPKQKTPSIWDRPPFPQQGDADKKEIWTAVGAAISAWGEYEAALGRLFTIFIAGEFPSPQARRAFGGIRSFEGRRELGPQKHFSITGKERLGNKLNSK
jgi:hypothetical protein